MQDPPSDPAERPTDIAEISDLLTLRALANVDRARLLDVLAVHGPATTTALSRRLGLATGSVSHHLRVLAKSGLVEPAPEAVADQRASAWKLVTRGRRWSHRRAAASAATQAAAQAAEGVILDRDYQRAREWQAAGGRTEWDDSAASVSGWMQLSPAELKLFGSQIEELILSWRRRTRPVEELDDEAVERHPVLAFFHAFPSEP